MQRPSNSILILALIIWLIVMLLSKEKSVRNGEARVFKMYFEIEATRELANNYRRALVETEYERDLIQKELSEMQSQMKVLKEKEVEIQKTKEVLEAKKVEKAKDVGNIFEVTAYDLSVSSCGKRVGDKGYGITASGKSLVGKSWNEARAIAVDKKVIPLGSKVKVAFIDERYQKYDGTYTAVDTGGAIKGNIIDLFLGDFNKEVADNSVWDFGRTKARVTVEGAK